MSSLDSKERNGCPKSIIATSIRWWKWEKQGNKPNGPSPRLVEWPHFSSMPISIAAYQLTFRRLRILEIFCHCMTFCEGHSATGIPLFCSCPSCVYRSIFPLKLVFLKIMHGAKDYRAKFPLGSFKSYYGNYAPRDALDNPPSPDAPYAECKMF